ncbi:MAG: inositol monophosphatase [Rhodospirillaceae bacterium]|nr:inositol monophosphatase [Rhodospirillaceae bacterium]MYB15064.1 inositol monophosphatase [Rhodospirillaceae bacterium]MYI50190.1 inositol monophosphatase [Rhodospirillaceae bacterium]
MALKPAIVNVMEGAARKAARGLVRDFGEVEQLQVSRKGPSDFVSAADLRAERTLLRELRKGRPEFGLTMEEGGSIPGADTPSTPGDPASDRWIVDPLDGTTNFLHGVPHFAVSIAHEAQGRVVAGVVYQPLTDELFWAVRGGGAFLNRRRLRVSSRSAMADALLATGLPYRGKPKHPAYGATLEAILPAVAGVRRFGAASLDLAWVAAGRFDGFWEFDLEPWDVAAGLLLVREAGGAVSDAAGRDRAWNGAEVLAGNAALHGELRRLVGDALRGAGESGE